MERFAREFGIGSETRILDIGGTPDCWTLLAERPRLTLLNTPRAADDLAGATWVAGDGRRLPFRDGTFDVVFSNSVIEHVGDAASQQSFAREVARVESLVPRGAAPADALHPLAAEELAAPHRPALQCLEHADAGDTRPAQVLHRALPCGRAAAELR
jgi:hypothetical protein